MKANEVAVTLQISRRQAYLWLAEGVFPVGVWFRAGRAVFFKRAALMAWIAGQDGHVE